MATFSRPQSLAEVARIGNDAETLSFAIRNFLDEFYADPAQHRLEEEPSFLGSVLRDDGLADAYLAGIAQHLTQQNGLRVPDWARLSDARRLKKPWFAMQSHGGRMFLLVESPAAFRERNIFISADALTRA
jgi:hypothetical protein